MVPVGQDRLILCIQDSPQALAILKLFKAIVWNLEHKHWHSEFLRLSGSTKSKQQPRIIFKMAVTAMAWTVFSLSLIYNYA